MAITAALATAFVPCANATTLVWDGATGTNNWSGLSLIVGGKSPIYRTNWSSTGSAPPVLAGNALVFGGTRGLANTNNYVNLSISSLSFAAGAGVFTLGGNTLNLSDAAGSSITNRSSNRQTIDLGITLDGTSVWQGGSAGLTFNGLVQVADANLSLGGGVTINNKDLLDAAGQKQSLSVGVNGTGTLSIEGGSVVSSGFGVLGLNAGGNGKATVTGTGSQWTANYFCIGCVGTGNLNIEDGGLVSVEELPFYYDPSGVRVTLSGTGILNIGAKGRATLDGGTLQIVDGTIAAGGLFDWRKGTLIYTGDASIGNGLLASTTTVGSGSTLKVGRNLSIDKGLLKIESGGVASNAIGYIGGGQADQGTVIVSGAGSLWNNAGELRIGSEGSGTLTIANGGVVSSPSGYVGHAHGSNGTVTVSGAGSLWNNAGSLYVGYSGTGILNIDNGGVVSNDTGTLGDNSGSSGTAKVSGAGSQWNTKRTLWVGFKGRGNLTIDSGGAVNSLKTRIGFGSAVLVTGAGSRMDTSQTLWVGDNTTGFLDIQAGGSVTAQDLFIDAKGGSLTLDGGTLQISNGSVGGQGSFNWIKGTLGFTGDTRIGTGLLATSTKLGSGQALQVQGGLTIDNGSLNIASGGVVSSRMGLIGTNAGDSGTVTVAGPNAQWNNAVALFAGQTGTGTLSILDAGTVTSSLLSIGSKGSVNLDGGTLQVASGYIAAGGSFNWIKGTLGFTEDTSIGDGLLASTTTVGSGKTLQVHGGLTIDNASLNIVSGGVVSNSWAALGSDDGSNGIANVSGAGATWLSTSDLSIGRDGAGTLTIENGGLVSNVVGLVGTNAGGSGKVTVTGGNAQWNNAALLAIGDQGVGTLSILDAGKVTASHLNIGAKGTVNLDGGTLQVASGYMAAGGSFNWIKGTLGFTGGTSIGTGLLASATTVGSGKTLQVNGGLIINNGSLNIASGGVVSSSWAALGSDPGGNGTVKVTGANAQWNNAANLDIGLDGAGSLSILDSGTVTAQVLAIGAKGTVHLDGGTLQIASGSIAPGGLFNWIKGTLGFTGDTSIGTGLLASTTTVGSGKTLKAVGNLIGDSASLNIAAGGVVSNTYGYLGSELGGTGSVTVAGLGAQWLNSSELHVGHLGTGTLNIGSGSLVSDSWAAIGWANGSSGVVNVSGAGAQWISTSDLNPGWEGAGVLNIDNGAVVSNKSGYVGANKVGSNGAVKVSGANSQWNNAANLYIGHNGTGSLLIDNGGLVSNTLGVVGTYAESNGSVVVTGANSQWANASSLTVGNSGTGTLGIFDSGKVTASALKIGGKGRVNLDGGTLQVASGSVSLGGIFNWIKGTLGFTGNASTGTGLLASSTTVGAGKALTVNGNLTHDKGSLNVEAGGVVSNAYGYVGSYLGSNGSVTVTGMGSRWLNSAELHIGDLGMGILNIGNGGVVSNTSAAIGWASGSSGTVNVSGAGAQWISTADLNVGWNGTGALNIENGGVVGNQNGYVGANGGSFGTVLVTGANSQWNNALDLSIGRDGAGTLNIEGGGAVNSAQGAIGYSAGSSGTVTLTGAGSSWRNAGDLSVGHRGTGILNVLAGAEVSNVYGYIGREGGAGSVVTVSGAGSSWTTSSALYVSNGSLVVRDGGLASSQVAYLGAYAGKTGAVTVSGLGAQWNLADVLYVGAVSSGTLTIDSGGQVSSARAAIASTLGSSGTVTVTGAGSSWRNAGELSVGYGGTGSLNVLAGAQVSNAEAYIGREGGPGSIATVSGAGSRWATGSVLYVNNGSLVVREGGVASSQSALLGAYEGKTGAATVTGAGSQWRNAGSLYMGTAGTGTLSILDFGRVSAQALGIGSKGTLNLGQGAQLATVNGTVNGNTVTFNGDSSIEGHFTNNGSVVGSAGTLSFLSDVSGAGSYAGNVLFKAGYAPGNSPAAVDFGGGNVSFDSGSVLNIELYGATPGTQYDQLLHINTLTFNGTLNLTFGAGYVPAAGSQLTLFDFASFAGSLGAEHITVSGYDKRLLDFSRLGTDGSLSVTAVPEPAHWALMLAGLAGLAWKARRQRPHTPRIDTALVLR